MGGKNGNGYGSFWCDGHPQLAHRLAWTLERGPIGDKLVLHHCDTPACVRPDHLYLGTTADNNRDALVRGRIYRPKLSPDDVRDIRRLVSEGQTRVRIAAQFGVHHSLIHQIIRRKIWAHVV
jgi:hypothetical protein